MGHLNNLLAGELKTNVHDLIQRCVYWKDSGHTGADMRVGLLRVYSMLINVVKCGKLLPNDIIRQRDRCAGIQVTSTAVTYKRPNITLKVLSIAYLNKINRKIVTRTTILVYNFRHILFYGEAP